MSKRKRATVLDHAASTVKKRRLLSVDKVPKQPQCSTRQPLLNHCYREVKTLKSFLLDGLPAASRVRRKRIAQFGEQDLDHKNLLENTLVGIDKEISLDYQASRRKELIQFTQTRRAADVNTATFQTCTLDEVIDFAVCALFKNHDAGSRRPNHVLCHGLERSITSYTAGADTCRPILPGILQRYNNPGRQTLQQPLWQELFTIAGADGESLFTTLLLDCGIFTKLDQGVDNYRQLSGIPLHELCLGKTRRPNQDLHIRADAPEASNKSVLSRKPSEINIVRSRMLYSKPSLDRNECVRFGLKRIHVLNRFADCQNEEQDLRLIRYIFPRQFKLHNVFTSPVDRKETVQAFKDYTFREEELHHQNCGKRAIIPRRLRKGALDIARKLRSRHHRCSYDQLLAHYCAVHETNRVKLAANNATPMLGNTCRLSNASPIDTQPRPITSCENTSIPCLVAEENNGTSYLPYATTPDQVSAFCRAALRRVLPHQTFGVGDQGDQNWATIMAHVDRFVRMRRFETISLHELLQGLRLTCITWLAPDSVADAAKLAASDKRKREELLHEVIYYVFDSLLIPLISANFYVTESGIHRNKLLFFRHDVWTRLCQPTLASARVGTLVSVSRQSARVQHKLAQLGPSLVRLLPKESGTRSITNLRRRTMKIVNGKRILMQSTNAQLTPVFNIFDLERRRDTGVYKADSISMQDLYAKLLAYKANCINVEQQPHYFVKVDIQSAFDSIPQQKLLDLVNGLFKNQQYCISRHAQSKKLGGIDNNLNTKTTVRFMNSAKPVGTLQDAAHLSSLNIGSRNHSVFSDTGQCHLTSRDQAKKLLRDHVLANIVRVGNKFYKQSKGIPQGSILSSLLCTFFYNDFEACKLNFLSPENSLLLRVIDDFLLITRSKAEAVQFVKAMKAGDESYGIVVHPEKSLVNFDMVIDSVQVPKRCHTTLFPYCGLFIDTETLEVSKDRVRKDNVMANTLTVDVYGHVGEKFKRRIIGALRIQLQSILLDTRLNDRLRVMRTLIECFQEATMKMHQYYAHLPKHKKPAQKVLVDLVQQLISLASRAVQQLHSKDGSRLSRLQICCLAASAMISVLSTRNTHYHAVLEWLRELQTQTEQSLNSESKTLQELVRRSMASMKHHVY